MSDDSGEPEASVSLSKGEAKIYRAMTELASQVGSVEEVMDRINENSDEEVVFVPYSKTVKRHPATTDELKACLSSRRLTMNRTQQETAHLLLQWMESQWQAQSGLSREDREMLNSLNEKLLDIGDDLYEQRGGEEPSLEDPAAIFREDDDIDNNDIPDL